MKTSEEWSCFIEDTIEKNNPETATIIIMEELEMDREEREAKGNELKQSSVIKSLPSDFEKWLKKNKWSKVAAIYSQPAGKNGDGRMEYRHAYIDELESDFKRKSKRGNV